jgi:hypothetical protein
MLSGDSNYRRLKVGGVTLFSGASYWQGPDHLLMVEVQNYAERYRRFHYRDILAFVVRETPWWWIGVAVGALGTLVFLLAIVAVVGGRPPASLDTETLIGLLSLVAGLAVSLLTVVLNLVWGRTCVCEIHTAVQVQTLPGIRRQAGARRLLDALSPVIAVAQAVRTSDAGHEPPRSESAVTIPPAAAPESSPG